MLTLYNFNDTDSAFLSNQIEIFPTEEQKAKLHKYMVATDYVYDIIIDWMDDKYIDYLSDNCDSKFLSMFDCGERLKELKENDPMLIDIPIHIIKMVYRKAIYAYKAFLDGRYNHPKKHYPNNIRCFIDIDFGSGFYIKDGYMTIPGFADKSARSCGERVGKIKCQNIGLDSTINKIYNGCIYLDNLDHYYFYYTYQRERIAFSYPKTRPIGIDLGYRLDGSNTIVCSDGIRYNLPDTKHLQCRIAQFQSFYSKEVEIRKAKYGDNSDQYASKKELEFLQKFRLAHRKLTNVLDTFYNQATIDIIKRNPEAIVIEDCFAADLKRNSKNNFINYGVTSSGKIREMIVYKANLYRIPVYIASKEFQSSYICSRCGRLNIKDLRQKQVFNCDYCKFEIDRDLNAAINLENIYNFKNLQMNYNYYIKQVIM